MKLANIVNKLNFFFLLFLVSVNASASDQLNGSWVLEVENKNHIVITTLVIRFTEVEASSCRGGNWFKVIVDSRSTTDSEFFPYNSPLSYEIRGEKIIIGRNEVCDAYLQLIGNLNQSKITGEYSSWGWSSEALGYFSLKQAPKNK